MRPEFGKIYDPDVAAAFEEAVKKLSGLGVAISDAKLPDFPYDETAILIIAVEAAAAFEPLITSGRVRELVEPAANWAGDAAKSISGVDYVRAMQARRLIQQAFDEMFQRYDLLISPTMPIVAAKLTDKLETAFAYSDPLRIRWKSRRAAGPVHALRLFERRPSDRDPGRWTTLGRDSDPGPWAPVPGEHRLASSAAACRDAEADLEHRKELLAVPAARALGG